MLHLIFMIVIVALACAVGYWRSECYAARDTFENLTVAHMNERRAADLHARQCKTEVRHCEEILTKQEEIRKDLEDQIVRLKEKLAKQQRHIESIEARSPWFTEVTDLRNQVAVLEERLAMYRRLS